MIKITGKISQFNKKSGKFIEAKRQGQRSHDQQQQQE